MGYLAGGLFFQGEDSVGDDPGFGRIDLPRSQRLSYFREPFAQVYRIAQLPVRSPPGKRQSGTDTNIQYDTLTWDKHSKHSTIHQKTSSDRQLAGG